MKRFYIIVFLVLFSSLAMERNSFGGWILSIEDKTVNKGSARVTLDFTGEWDKTLTRLVLPIVVRKVEDNCFWKKPLPVDTTGGDRVGVEWKWTTPGWTNIILMLRPGVPASPCDPDGDTGYDGVSPDHFAIGAEGTSPEAARPAESAYLTITFDLNDEIGSFEFDTACFTGSLHTIYMTEGAPLYTEHGPAGNGDAVFNKGIVTCVCECGGHFPSYGDANCDGGVNPVDVVYMVNYVYKGIDQRCDDGWFCPLEPGDVNCDGSVNPIDVVHYVNYVYKNIIPFPCDPCE